MRHRKKAKDFVLEDGMHAVWAQDEAMLKLSRLRDPWAQI